MEQLPDDDDSVHAVGDLLCSWDVPHMVVGEEADQMFGRYGYDGWQVESPDEFLPAFVDVLVEEHDREIRETGGTPSSTRTGRHFDRGPSPRVPGGPKGGVPSNGPSTRSSIDSFRPVERIVERRPLVTGSGSVSRRVHLHRDDYPVTLTLLGELATDRRALDGYESTPEDAYVDWTVLAEHLNSTERAVVLIAEGVAELERKGGAPPGLRAAVLRAVRDVA